MQLFGIDFTSAPSRRKTIACAVCQLADDVLHVERIHRWRSLDEFASFLATGDDWLAAIDAPLGQPQRLVTALNWPENWAGYVEHVRSMTKSEFVDLISRYSRNQPSGDKHHFRATDGLAGSCSPMMMYGVPVGRMFYEAATRLLTADVSVLPCRPNNSGRVVVESYPALMARRVIGRTSYKGDEKKEAKLFACRREIVAFYVNKNPTGVRVQLSAGLRDSIIADPSGDGLDAVLCAIQIASKSRIRPDDLGIPSDANRIEGWIVDLDLTSFSGWASEHR